MEQNFIDGTLIIPRQGSEEGECQEKELMDEETDVTRKRGVATENADVHAHKSKKQQSKRRKVGNKEMQEPTGVILENVGHDKSNEASNTAVVLRHVLKIADAFSEMKEKMEEAHERMEEKLKVLHVDMQHLRDRLEQHLQNEKENCAFSDATMTMDVNSIQPEVLAEVIMQQASPQVTCATPRAITAVNDKYKELSPEDIDRTKLRSIPEVLQKYPELQTDAKMGVLGVKLAREALFGDDIMKRCTPRGWQDLPALPQGKLFVLKTALWNQFPCYWSCPEAFEKKWVTVQEAVAQACKRLRNLRNSRNKFIGNSIHTSVS